MIQDDIRVAIDLGTTKVCTIVGKRRSDGEIDAGAFGVRPCAGLERGLVADAQATTAAVRDSVRMASEATGMPISAAYLGLTGSHVESKNLWSKVEGNGGITVVTQSDMRRALSVASDDAQTEGRDLLHVFPRSYALDGIYGVRNPLGMHAGEMYIQTHAILGATYPISTIKAAVEAAGVRVAGLVVEPVAAAEAVLTQAEKEEGVVILDVGGGTTDIAVFSEGSIVHTAVLPVGGHQFTNDIAVSFDCSYDEAERIKLSYGSAAPDMKTLAEEFEVDSASFDEPLFINRRELGQLMEERAAELFKMVKAKLEVEHLAGVPLRRVVLVGGASKLDGFAAIARYVLQCQIRMGETRGADPLHPVLEDPAYAASVGVLLWGMRNLPRESHVEKPRQQGRRWERLGGAVRDAIPVIRKQRDSSRTPVGT